MSTIDPSGSARLKEMLERALAFTERLLAENARLRRTLATAHAGTAGASTGDARVAALRLEIEGLQREIARRDAHAISVASPGPPGPFDEPTEAMRRLEEELARERRQRLELEEQNNSLANLYVASHQLHSTLDFNQVVSVVMEIVVNLIGADRFALLLVDTRTSRLQVIGAEGLEAAPAPIPLGTGILGEVASRGEAYFRAADHADGADLEHPLAAIPLKVEDRVIGVLAVWGLFAQKKGFAPLDLDLFKLLAGHAATAIFAAKAHGDSERKLSTIQGFLDLLTTG